MPKLSRTLTEGQRAYEAKRAEKAGMSLEKWLATKDRAEADAAREAARARKAETRQAKPKGIFGRLIDWAHKPI
jgi:hypothetical protein